ncbi:hypothetical protein RMATCC62417_10543 [Rhizopus microsporus]|nr:hypothetical protein RMATCC62417_10543 [Rhizopus microsporus]
MSMLVNRRVYKKWLLAKFMGYSSIAALLLSLFIYMYYKKHQKKSVLLKRSTLSLNDLRYTYKQQESLLTPPPSPTGRLSPRSWSARLIDNVMSATGMKKKLTISIKNTILWNPSRDVNIPNHAFHENTISLLTKLSQNYDIYVIIHMNTKQEQDQIDNLLYNSNLFKCVDSRKVLYCSTEQGKIHIIRHIEPSIHIEGGWELEDGNDIVKQLRNDTQVIWILPNQKRQSLYSDQYNDIEISDHVLNTSVAKSVGF